MDSHAPAALDRLDHACEMEDHAQFIQVAQLSQRDRAAGWVSNGQKWKTGTERQYLRTM